jgi:hypothetical protein
MRAYASTLLPMRTSLTFDGVVIWRDMDYSSHSIHLLKPMEELDIDRVFPQPVSKRKTAFKLIANGMTVAEWLAKVARAGLGKVDVSFITQCYAKDEPHRYERKLIELRPPTSRT